MIKIWKMAHPAPRKRAEQSTGQTGSSPHANQQKNDFASVDVSVKTQGVGKWLGNIFDQIEQDIDRPQYGIFAEWSAHQFVYPAAQPFDLYVEKNHQQPDRERQRKRGVDVGGRDAAPVVQTEQRVDPGHDIYRQEVHRIHHKNPHKYGERRRCNERVAVAMKSALNLLINEFNGQLDKCLTLAGHAGCRAAHHPPQKTEAHDAQ